LISIWFPVHITIRAFTRTPSHSMRYSRILPTLCLFGSFISVGYRDLQHAARSRTFTAPRLQERTAHSVCPHAALADVEGGEGGRKVATVYWLVVLPPAPCAAGYHPCGAYALRTYHGWFGRAVWLTTPHNTHTTVLDRYATAYLPTLDFPPLTSARFRHRFVFCVLGSRTLPRHVLCTAPHYARLCPHRHCRKTCPLSPQAGLPYITSCSHVLVVTLITYTVVLAGGRTTPFLYATVLVLVHAHLLVRCICKKKLRRQHTPVAARAPLYPHVPHAPFSAPTALPRYTTHTHTHLR